MCGRIQYSWNGAGEGYTKPGAPGSVIRTAATNPRWFPKDTGMSSAIMSSGAQNRADSAQFSEATKHAGVDSKKM